MWSKYHYAKSPVVEQVRCVGTTMRYLLKTGSVDLVLEGSRFPAGISACTVDESEIIISYIGMGGGGVGAAACRSDAAGVLRSRSDESGGGKVAGSTIWLPRMQRVLIGVDDTDTPEEGATWTLVHNIAKAVEDEHTVYLSHTIVQLFPGTLQDQELRRAGGRICHNRSRRADCKVPPAPGTVYAVWKNRDGRLHWIYSLTGFA